jgi:CDP-4-dehydro-6-deoxyglucose reductase
MALRSGAVDYPRFAPGLPPGLVFTGETAGEVLACQAVPRGPVSVEPRELRSAGEVEVKKLPCRVARVAALAPGIFGLWLQLPAVEPLEYRAGQYVNLWLPDGRQRSFSLAAPPHAGPWLELHLRESPAMQASGLLSGLRVGSLLTVEGPFGELGRERLPLPQTAAMDPVVLVAGGTGYAPLQALLWQWLECGTQRPVHLYWGARTPVELYRDAWLRERSRGFAQFRYVPVLSAPVPSAAPAVVLPFGASEPRHGLVHEAVLADLADPKLFPPAVAANLQVVAAGPTAMIEALRAGLQRRGHATARFTCDAYG